MASLFVFLVLILALVGASDATWCVCKSDQPTPTQQKALDYACGAGADCTPILQNGVCFNPNNVNAHCSYAVNSYYQRKAQAPGSCDFSGTAMIVSNDPSPGGGCTYPASPSAAGTSNTPGSASSPGTSTPPPNSLTPNTGGTGTGTGSGTGTGTGTGTGSGTGIIGGGGLGPSGTSISTDGSDASFPPMPELCSSSFFLLFSCLVFLWL